MHAVIFITTHIQTAMLKTQTAGSTLKGNHIFLWQVSTSNTRALVASVGMWRSTRQLLDHGYVKSIC